MVNKLIHGVQGSGVRGQGSAEVKEAAGFAREETLVGFGQAFRRRREHLALTLDALAALTGISKPYLSNIETARAPGPPSEEKLERMAEALGLERGSVLAAADWLRTPESVRKLLMDREAEGVVRRADGAIDLDALVREKPEAGQEKQGVRSKEHEGGVLGVLGVPVINKVAAGRAGEFGDLGYPAGVADAYVPAPDMPDGRGEMAGAFAVVVTGDSMEPEYVEGETVVVSGAEAGDGDDCVVRLGERENFATTLKRVFFVKEGEGAGGEVVGVRLVPLNAKYAERVVGLEEVSGVYPVMYKVSRVKRGGRGEGKSSKGKSSKGAGGKGEDQEARLKVEGDVTVSPPTADGEERGGGRSSGFSLEND